MNVVQGKATAVLSAILLLSALSHANAETCDGSLNTGATSVTTRKPRILFMCVANSARSQLAEALARHIFGDNAVIQSAGSEPKNVNPFAVQALQEIGVPVDHMVSKGISDLDPEFLPEIDLVITLCADEVCPILPSRGAKRLHWPYPDPAGVQGSDANKLEKFRETRDLIRKRVIELAIHMGIEPNS